MSGARMMAALRRRAVPYTLGIPMGACIYGATDDLLHWPEPLPTLVGAARQSIPVLDSLGSPIIRSPMWTGSAGRESVAAAVPLFGPRGRGTLHARAFYVPEVASKETTDAPNARKDPIGEGTNLIQFGSWHPVILLLELPSGQVIDLLDDGKTVEAGAGPWATDATGPHHMAPSDTDSPPNT